MVNRAMSELTGCSREELLAMPPEEMMSLVHPDDREMVAGRLRRRLAGKEVPTRYRFRITRRDGQVRWWEQEARIITCNGRPAIQTFILDITTDKKTEHSMKRLLIMETIVASISSRFVSSTDFDSAVTATLKERGTMAKTERVHLFMLARGGDTLSATHEWCGEGSPGNRDQLQNLPCSSFPWCIEQLRGGRMIVLESLDDLPAEAAVTRNMLSENGIRTYLALPVMVERELAGYISFNNLDWPEIWSRANLGFLETCAGILSAAMQQNWYEQALNESRESLEGSLREKEVLLREVHHRVKNNMQIISSLLRLQRYATEESGDASVEDILDDCQRRIRTMALVHEKLYRSKDFVYIDFEKYIRDLAGDLSASMSGAAAAVGFDIQSDPVKIDIGQLIPCGLIINELVINILRHAYPAGEEGTASIECRELDDGSIELTVADSGRGLPDGFDLGRTDTLGLQLVTMLATDQLNGAVEVLPGKGTAIRITFPRGGAPGKGATDKEEPTHDRP